MTTKAGAVLVTAVVALAFAAIPAAAQTRTEASGLTIDQLLAIDSVVGGEPPRWSPDGDRILFASGLTGGLLTVPVEGGFPSRIPVELGGSGHFLASQMPTWSPQGRWISYISDKSGAPEIWLWSTQDGREIQLTDLGGRINAVSWSPDGQAIAFSNDRYGSYDIWKVSVATGQVHRLTADPRYEVFPTWSPDAASILYVTLDDRWVDHDVVQMPAGGGAGRVVVRDTEFFDYGAGSTFGFPQVSPDGTTVLFRSQRSGWINYWLVPLAGGEPRRLAPALADQSQARFSPDGASIVYVENHNGTHQLRLASTTGGEPKVLVAPAVGIAAAPDWSPDGRMVSYTMSTVTRPADLYVVAVASGQTTQLTDSMPAGHLEERLTKPRKVTYPSTDGLTISAYLYEPPAGTGRHPGVLWIHGGPTSQFNDTFQQHVQFFVEQGYVVLLPNIRGSSGYGRAFEEANNGCWSHCDLEDVLAGVDYLQGLDSVDAERIGITGTSYGGIMSMAAAAFAPGVFRAAIPASGYADWIAFYHGENELRHVKLLEHELGRLDEHEEVWRRASAVYAAHQVATPLFLIHGEGRYPGSPQSQIFAEALTNHYKPFRYTTYPNENYYVRSRANRRQMLLDMRDFFDQFLRDEIVDVSDAGGGGGVSR